MRIVNPASRFEYVIEADRASEAKTVFVLRPLTWSERQDLVASAPFSPELIEALTEVRERCTKAKAALDAWCESEQREPGAEELAACMPNADDTRLLNAIDPQWRAFELRQARWYGEICAQGIVGIRGLVDQDGNPLDTSVEKFCAVADVNVLVELGDEIMRISRLSEALRKNSLVPPTPGQ